VQLVQPNPHGTFGNCDTAVRQSSTATTDNISVSNNATHITTNSNDTGYITTSETIRAEYTITQQSDNASKHARIQQRQDRLSPTNSPHKLGKVGPKWPRTVEARNLSKSSLASTSLSLDSGSTTSFCNQHLTIQSFHSENKEDAVKTMLQSYIVQKCIFNVCPNLGCNGAVLSEIRQFLNNDNYTCPQVPSNVHYLELVDENPDSCETKSVIAEDILEKFSK